VLPPIKLRGDNFFIQLFSHTYRIASNFTFFNRTTNSFDKRVYQMYVYAGIESIIDTNLYCCNLLA